jgi:hypothetical protein
MRINYLKLVFSLISFLFVGTFFPQVNLSASLTACYALDGSAVEPINNLTGTLSAVTATVDRFNNPGSAMRFNGTASSKIKLPSNTLIKPTSDLSFSAWIKPESLTSMEIVFTKNIYSMYFSAYALTFQNNGQGYKFRGYRQNGSTSNFIDGTTVVTNPNSWYHVVLTIDNNNMRIYVNGVLENTVACFITSYNYQTGKEVILGGTNETVLDFPFLGSMDNVRFYNRVINASEVATLYSQDPTCLTGSAPVTSFTSSVQQICEGASITFNNT